MEIDFRPAQVDSGEGGRLAQAMREEIASIYPGLELDGAQMPKAGAAELSPPHGGFWVGYADGAPACCGGLKRLPDGPAEIKKMFVDPPFRSRGVARALLAFLEGEARRLGYEAVRLDTGPDQPHSRALYESAGYEEIGNFNANPVATYFAEKRLS